MKDLFTLTGSIDEYFKCFTESNDCYQLFGFDVMITKDYQVKILEVNSGPGTRSLIMPFWKKLFENQLKLMVDTTLLSNTASLEPVSCSRQYPLPLL